MYFAIFLITEEKTRIFESIIKMLNWFAGKQIRNVAVSIISTIILNIFILIH